MDNILYTLWNWNLYITESFFNGEVFILPVLIDSEIVKTEASKTTSFSDPQCLSGFTVRKAIIRRRIAIKAITITTTTIAIIVIILKQQQ